MSAKPPSRSTPGSRMASKRPSKAVVDEVAPSSAKDAQGKLTELAAQVEKEKEQRNLMQLERDKIHGFWDIQKQENENLRAELRNKDREMEELEERHQVEMKVYKQKVKHLHYEHQNNLTQLKTDGEVALKVQNDENKSKEVSMKKMNKKSKQEMKELEVSHEDVTKNLKMEHDKTITRLRQEYERNIKELHSKYEKKMKQLRQDLELRRKNEIHEIEERKNAHINELIKKHDQAFAEIKAYYNDITANNLELIKSLKDQLEEMKKKEASDQKLMLEVNMENKRLTEPLQRALKEVEHLRHDLANYNKDRESLQSCKSRIKVLEQEYKNLKWEHEVLEQRFVTIQKERDELYKNFVSAIHDVQKQSGLRNLLLEKKLDSMSQEVETKDVQLNQIIAAMNLDAGTVRTVTEKVDNALKEKNDVISQLQFELSRVKKANTDIARVYQAKLTEYGVPSENLAIPVDVA